MVADGFYRISLSVTFSYFRGKQHVQSSSLWLAEHLWETATFTDAFFFPILSVPWNFSNVKLVPIGFGNNRLYQWTEASYCWWFRNPAFPSWGWVVYPIADRVLYIIAGGEGFLPPTVVRSSFPTSHMSIPTCQAWPVSSLVGGVPWFLANPGCFTMENPDQTLNLLRL